MDEYAPGLATAVAQGRASVAHPAARARARVPVVFRAGLSVLLAPYTERPEWAVPGVPEAIHGQTG